MALDMPFGMRAVFEEDDVARTMAGRAHRVVFNDARSLEDQDRLIEIIVPVEPTFATLPDHRGGEPVRALLQNAPLRDRIALDDPGQFDRFRRQIDNEVSRFDQRARHHGPQGERISAPN